MRANWREGEATVTSVVTQSVPGITTYGVVFTYTVKGSYYAGRICTIKPHVQGQKLQLWYDPQEPGCNNLVQRERWKNYGYGIFLAALGLAGAYIYFHPRN